MFGVFIKKKKKRKKPGSNLVILKAKHLSSELVKGNLSANVLSWLKPPEFAFDWLQFCQINWQNFKGQSKAKSGLSWFHRAQRKK